MFKISTTIRKEFALLFTDKVGLVLMFLMPIVLVVVLTVVQNSAFRIVNENKLSLMVVNHDQGSEGDALISILEESKLFTIKKMEATAETDLKNLLVKQDQQLLIAIPSNYSQAISEKSAASSNKLMTAFGMGDSTANSSASSTATISFIHDPVLEDNYTISVLNVLQTFIQQIEAERMMGAIFKTMGYTEIPQDIKSQLKESAVALKKEVAIHENSKIIPNATQHNVPAWTVFAMFFMVVSLGNNMVKEKVRGSFIRLKSTPTNFAWVIGSKMLVYFVAAFSQVMVIFSIGKYVFPLLDLPALHFPNHILTLLLVIFTVSVSAISYAILIGCVATSTEQSNGFGSVSVVIFAAHGGVWGPLFVMPEGMQIVAKFSPLYWGLDAFYGVLLRDQNTLHLFGTLGVLWAFSFTCLGIGFFRLQTEKLI